MILIFQQYGNTELNLLSKITNSRFKITKRYVYSIRFSMGWDKYVNSNGNNWCQFGIEIVDSSNKLLTK